MRSLRANALWLITSLVLAFMVWIVATLQVDPVGVVTFRNVPIQFVENDAMIVTNRVRETVSVNVTARQSVRNLMTAEDLTVRADWSNLPEGTNNVLLKASTPRDAHVETVPTQITVTLELSQLRQKPVVVEIIGEPPPGYTHGDPELSRTQIRVSGTLAQVDRVDHLRATVDLRNQRTPYDNSIAIVPVSATGEVLNDVTLDASSVHVTIDVRQREDVVEVPVRPDIDFASAPDGYAVRLDTYSPLNATIRGSPAALARLPEVLNTDTIDLSNHTETFTTTVPLLLPGTLSAGQVTVLDGQTIDVQIVIEARIGQQQMEDIPVEVIGGNPNVRVIPSRVTVLVTGPQPLLDELSVSDITVTVDVTGLAPGEYDLQPEASLVPGSIAPDEVRVIPATVGVIISEL